MDNKDDKVTMMKIGDRVRVNSNWHGADYVLGKVGTVKTTSLQVAKARTLGYTEMPILTVDFGDGIEAQAVAEYFESAE